MAKTRNLEECKVGMRNVRKEFHNLLRDAKKDKSISEDFANRLMDSLEKVTSKFCKNQSSPINRRQGYGRHGLRRTRADELAAKKEKEITTI